MLDAPAEALEVVLARCVRLLIAREALVTLVHRRLLALSLVLVASVQDWDGLLTVSTNKSLLRLLQLLVASSHIFSKNRCFVALTMPLRRHERIFLILSLLFCSAEIQCRLLFV